ncbi:MAG: DUF3316 domain-containing protein [Dysgonamonadaceae bacterium]|jgi:hypothetical protein|nr:DUF3316 domain-containing protein [Dysgonamonadaceae bacterium]
MQKKWCVAFFVWLVFSTVVFPQQESDSLCAKPVNRAVLLGMGRSALADSYLSPLEYDGLALSLLYDQLNGSRFFNEKLLLQHRFQVEIASTRNPAETSSEYLGIISYGLTGLYPIARTPKLRVFGGTGWDVGIGGIYNLRNSNNPGSLKLSTNLNLSALAIYNCKNFTFRWQMGTPFLGLYFSPDYGQSYYEIFSLGNDDGTVVLGSFHNQIGLRNYFTVDYPVGNFTIRAGYLGNYYRTEINNLTTKIISHQLMLGFATELLNFGGKKIKEHSWLKSVYY